MSSIEMDANTLHIRLFSSARETPSDEIVAHSLGFMSSLDSIKVAFRWSLDARGRTLRMRCDEGIWPNLASFQNTGFLIFCQLSFKLFTVSVPPYTNVLCMLLMSTSDLYLSHPNTESPVSENPKNASEKCPKHKSAPCGRKTNYHTQEYKKSLNMIKWGNKFPFSVNI